MYICYTSVYTPLTMWLCVYIITIDTCNLLRMRATLKLKKKLLFKNVILKFIKILLAE